VVFLADNSPTTGVSWCPDCVRCGPAVKRVCAEQAASLLEVLVGQRQVWKDPQHPLRCAEEQEYVYLCNSVTVSVGVAQLLQLGSQQIQPASNYSQSASQPAETAIG
jgi:hypothetical protein